MVRLVEILEGKPVIYVADDGPVHEVPGMQDGNPGHRVEARSDHLEIAAYPDHIRIGVVCEKNRIFMASVAEIGYPDPGGNRRKQEQEYDREFDDLHKIGLHCEISVPCARQARVRFPVLWSG
jgi:hypothetical protein